LINENSRNNPHKVNIGINSLNAGEDTRENDRDLD